MEKLKLAVIGCGAVTRVIHLPVIARSDQVDLAVLVDKSLPIARQLADSYGVPDVADDYRQVLGRVDAAIVALPHSLHAPVTVDLLQHGIHVLVEKPMALKMSDCDEMIQMAASSGVVLAVGLIRRFYESSQFVKQVLESALLGDISSFGAREGSVYRWKVASDFMFRREAGGGVLADTGAHALDMLLWWLGDYESVEYYDDAMGGVEADCRLHLRLQSGATGVVELSRIRDLRNVYTIHGERGTLEVGTRFDSSIRLRINGQDIVLSGRAVRDGATEMTKPSPFSRQLYDFANAVLDHREPLVPGQEGKRGVELIEECYAVRQPLKYPWTFPEMPMHWRTV
jgi:predicted dehydrogenase